MMSEINQKSVTFDRHSVVVSTSVSNGKNHLDFLVSSLANDHKLRFSYEIEGQADLSKITNAEMKRAFVLDRTTINIIDHLEKWSSPVICEKTVKSICKKLDVEYWEGCGHGRFIIEHREKKVDWVNRLNDLVKAKLGGFDVSVYWYAENASPVWWVPCQMIIKNDLYHFTLRMTGSRYDEDMYKGPVEIHVPKGNYGYTTHNVDITVNSQEEIVNELVQRIKDAIEHDREESEERLKKIGDLLKSFEIPE